MKIIQDNKEINIEFISKIHLDFKKKKKKTAHAYLKHRILSLLAGKFTTFEQMLLTERIKEKLAHAYFYVFHRENLFKITKPFA